MLTSVIRSLPLIALCAAVSAQTTATTPPASAGAAAVPMSPTLYLVIYTAGPNWKPDVPAGDQLRDHGRYMLGLHQKTLLKMAGPFTDAAGGAAVIETDTLAAAQAIADADPAVQSKVFAAEVHAWRHVDWDALARRLQPRPAQP